MTTPTQGTHWDGCEKDHHECALAKLAAARSQIEMLRTGDTCARHCEGTAYRIEARRLATDLAAAQEARDIAVADAIFAKAAMESGDKLLKEAQEALDQCRTLYNETIQRAVRAETLAEQNAKDAKEAIAIAGFLFDAWEDGTPCFETDGESGMGASIGKAFKLSNEDFTRCTEFLNRVDPRGAAIDAAIAGEPK